jgi:hypothetical protein
MITRGITRLTQYSGSKGLCILVVASLAMFISIAMPLAGKAEDDCTKDFRTCTEAQIKALPSRALLGDGKVAMFLAGDPKISAKEKLYWTTISAEDGFSPGIEQLGVLLRDDDSDPRNIVRARYWLKVAKSRGQKIADFDLCLLNKKVTPSLPDCRFPIEDVETH